MPITYRTYKKREDLELQTNLWLKATKNLPWAWKPNNTQKWFTEQMNFDPNSKLYAYDGDSTPIGYVSSIRREGYTPMGFPWVSDGYEGEIQDYLFDTVYNYALKNFDTKSFLQRFRKEWKYQIEFFEKKGFRLAWSNPIYVLELPNKQINESNGEFESIIHDKIILDPLIEIVNYDDEYKKEDKEEIKSYFEADIQLDWVLQLNHDSKPVAMSAFTCRKDTGYAELNLLAVNHEYPKALNLALEMTINELVSKRFKYFSKTVHKDDPRIDFYESYNFKLTSESVFYSKKLD